MRFDPRPELAEETLTLPLSTGEYEVPAVTARDGIKLKALNSALEAIARRVQAGELQAAATEDEVERRGISLDDLDQIETIALSEPVREQMVNDGATLREVEVAGMTAFLWHSVADGGNAARVYWDSGGRARPQK